MEMRILWGPIGAEDALGHLIPSQSPVTMTPHHASVLVRWELKIADFCVLRVVNAAVFVVHFRKVTTSVKR